jgi:NAD(P)-dependent dehydrogenase (short-subunit alcohol dehydrogenase family)
MILDKFRLDGKVALITGATRGIGLGIAKAFAEAGADIVASSKNVNPSALQEIDEAGDGRKVEYVQADMEDMAAPKALVEETLRLKGRIDILVVNHGVAGHGPTETFPFEKYRKIMTTNLDSLFLLCQQVIEPMRKQKGGVILAIGSISGLISNIPQAQAAYNASKAAVHMFTQSMGSDYAAENIRVNSIAPGYIGTDMTQVHFDGPEWGPTWKAQTPMGRMGTVDEIATAALFMCSDASSYVTGEVLVVDGGYTAR